MNRPPQDGEHFQGKRRQKPNAVSRRMFQRESKGKVIMTIEEKGRLIAHIIRTLRTTARIQKKTFDEGDTFFALAFKSYTELERIARLVIV